MKIRQSRFVTSAVSRSQYPEGDLPEIAFAGRSNVGKSSIINMLLGRKGLAKTSATPGKTQLVNFFDIDGLFRFVDLPGYGFAKVSKEVKQNWGKMIEGYLKHRPQLIEVVLLLDIRHIPTAEDVQMYQWIEQAGHEVFLIGTKADKVSRQAAQKQIQAIRAKLGAPATQKIFLTSSVDRQGKYEVWDEFNRKFAQKGYDIFVERQQPNG